MRNEIRYAIRGLLRDPVFALMIVLSLAVGIGANTAMFSVAHAVLWRSLPYPNPDRLVTIGEVDKKDPKLQWGASYPNFRDWLTRTRSLEHFAPILFDDGILRAGSDPVRVSGGICGLP